MNPPPPKTTVPPADPSHLKHKRRFCRIEGCNRIVKSQGLCQRHGAKPRKCKVEGCDKQAQGNFDKMCKAHFKAMKRATTPLPKVTQGSMPPPPEGFSVYDGILPASIAYTPQKGTVMPLITHLKAGFDGNKPPAWHRNEERRARGLHPIDNPATQLEGWERELVWMEILVLTGAPGASFRQLARAWGRDKGFHMVLAQFICERQGDVQRKKRRNEKDANDASSTQSKGPAKKRKRMKKSPGVISADIWDDSAYGNSDMNEFLAADIFNFSAQEFESATALKRFRQMEDNSDTASMASSSQRSLASQAATTAILGEVPYDQGGKIMPKPSAKPPPMEHPEQNPETSALVLDSQTNPISENHFSTNQQQQQYHHVAAPAGAQPQQYQYQQGQQPTYQQQTSERQNMQTGYTTQPQVQQQQYETHPTQPQQHHLPSAEQQGQQQQYHSTPQQQGAVHYQPLQNMGQNHQEAFQPVPDQAQTLPQYQANSAQQQPQYGQQQQQQQQQQLQYQSNHHQQQATGYSEVLQGEPQQQNQYNAVPHQPHQTQYQASSLQPQQLQQLQTTGTNQAGLQAPQYQQGTSQDLSAQTENSQAHNQQYIPSPSQGQFNMPLPPTQPPQTDQGQYQQSVAPPQTYNQTGEQQQQQLVNQYAAPPSNHAPNVQSGLHSHQRSAPSRHNGEHPEQNPETSAIPPELGHQPQQNQSNERNPY